MGKYTRTINEIHEKIKTAAAGREPGGITLVAATKTRSAGEIQAAIASGIRVCGENRVQEMLRKIKENAYRGAQLHFIGHLQTNKVKDVVGRVSLIQSVDSLKLAQAIDKAAKALNIKQDILLEVKLGGEPNKKGFPPDELSDIVKIITRFENIVVRGLMTIPPVGSDEHPVIKYFQQLHKIYVDITPKLLDNGHNHILSMGMSGDYEYAVSAGATMVRVGSAIFGERL
ncbi:MAG: YggS family pyridoxal phosphate-dependent enzyme [Oscillospiraceae bacterium]|nr:YggS family pyridoxal phosphate-dependent enzyme [Oscillospiraceae bacterium]